MDADCGARRAQQTRTAKSCGPDIPTLISGATRERCHPRRQESPVSGASTKETVKTIAQGMPVFSGEPVVANSRAFYSACEAAGASAPGIPCALLSERRTILQGSGAK